ncbi:MAG TPA: T9SS type A sorting domain-containing protein [Ignavibacteriaceae bacterium]
MRKLSTFLFVLAVTFMFVPTSFSQNLSVAQNQKEGGSPDGIEALVTINYDGANFTSIGDGGTTFIAGARFTPSITGPLTGGELRYVQFYYAQVATGLTIKIYDSGTASVPGALLLNQPLDLGSLIVPGWNEVELSTYIPISGNDLWICLEVADASAANFPLGCDAGPANANGDYVNDTGVWQHLAGFGLNYNWNIRGVVEDTPAPPPLFFENFDSYTAGNLVACSNPSVWTTWSNAPCGAEDAEVSSDFAHSGTNSAKIITNDDLVKKFGATAFTTGKYKISFYMYIPATKAGYFNTLATFAGSNSSWALEVYFDAGGAGRVNPNGQVPGTFSWTAGQWNLVEYIVDLNNDLGEFYFNGALVHTQQYTIGAYTTAVPLTLDANDFFGATASDIMYIDDYTLEDLTIVPVELSSFAANVNNGNVVLNWTTETELNNQGFEIQRRNADGQFITIGHVNGNGTTTERKQYSFTDAGVQTGSYYYRLKQVDFGGSFEYSNEIFVDVTAPLEFALNQNYPNPFNPTTAINFSIAEPTFVKLAVFNLLGQEVEVLKNEYMNAGTYNVTFDAASLPSGMYLYKIETAQYSSVRKMMLMK